MATFRAVNSSPLAAEMSVLVTEHHNHTDKDDAMTPSPATPRPSTAPQLPVDAAVSSSINTTNNVPDDATTPTRSSFTSTPTVAGQKPLPSSPFPQAVQVPDYAEAEADRPRRDNSQHSAKSSSRRDSIDVDVDMDESDGEEGASDDESVINADGTRSGKKKKSQRFYCTDYPPCTLSFTRSEHLARHIRKHTGERPFMCHCSRRFSRLDNLRQHAQTVHVNEDIPIDSLAATGSRFQRQIRTERVRQAGNRARASTSGSAAGPARGHSKSLSTSSINSISSVGSTYSTQPDARRRPPPLVMADPRASYSSYRPSSPSDFSTPTSATFSTGQGSPRWSGLASPSSTHSRSQSLYSAGARTPGRRLSVPSGANPFQSPHGPPGRPMFGPGSINSSNAGAFSTNNSSLVSSPTASSSGWSARRESTSSAADEAWRRRTWHPDSRSFSGHPSQLSTVVSQSAVRAPPPIANPSNTQSNLRLPGIESFDPIPHHRPITPPRRNPSPMMIDSDQPPPPRSALQLSGAESERNLNLYDASLQRGLTRLDIGPNTPPRDSAGAWATEVNKAVQAQAEQVRQNPTVRFEDQQPPSYQNPNPNPNAGRSLHHQTMSAPIITTSREGKRHGWYNGPVTVHREPPQPSPHDPRAAHVDRMVHPNFTAFSGFPGREPPAEQNPQERPPNGDPLGRLEALVAAATGEGSTATVY